MANNAKDFTDSLLKCRKCFAPIGWQRLSRQLLIIKDVAIYNWCRFSCLRCETVGEWQSPNLTDKQVSIDRRFPDSIRDMTLEEKAKKLGYTAKEKQTGAKPQNHFSAS